MLPPPILYGAIATVFLIVIMIAITLFLNKKIATVQDDITLKEKKLTELKVKLKEVQNYEKNNEEVRRKTQIIEQLKKKQIVPLVLLDEVSQRLPKGVWLMKITDKGGRVSVEGYAYTNSDLVTYVQNLKQSRHFIDVTLVESRQANIDAYAVYKFKMTFKVKV
jgi:type IV pilus assembly protein PilN